MSASSQPSYFEPLRKSVTVDRPVHEAFEVFTAGIGRWWPLKEYSICKQRAASCVLEPSERGKIYEVRDDGETFPWGSVVVWQPPHRLLLSWHPGRDPATAQEVELRFTAVGRGTLVELEHRDWAKLGEEAEEARASYEGGWETVLGINFVEGCRTITGRIA